MIQDVTITPLRQIPDDRGKIMHMLRCDDPYFEQFGEIYFSTIYPGVVKGWHYHHKMALNYVCISGTIRLVLYDNRENSPTKGNLDEIYLGESNYLLVHVPPQIWNGFMGVGLTTSIVANCATLPHDPTEIERLDPHHSFIPYDWAVKDR
jgi:dTDP-4-dehydrorhamnose 3,5-epimerase